MLIFMSKLTHMIQQLVATLFGKKTDKLPKLNHLDNVQRLNQIEDNVLKLAQIDNVNVVLKLTHLDNQGQKIKVI